MELGNLAFHSCKGLKTISLPLSLETIGEYCFQNSGLTELTIPNGLTKIERGALSWCSDLKKVVLSEGLETIPEACFGKSGIEKINVPKSVKTI